MDANGAAGLGEVGERTDGNTQLPRVLPLHREKNTWKKVRVEHSPHRYTGAQQPCDLSEGF